MRITAAVIVGIVARCTAPAHADTGVWLDGESMDCPAGDAFAQESQLSLDFFESDDAADDPMAEWRPRYLKLPAGCLAVQPGIWLPVAAFKKARAERADLQERVRARASGISKEAEERIESAEMWGWIFSAVGIVAGLAVGMCGDGDCTEF